MSLTAEVMPFQRRSIHFDYQIEDEKRPIMMKILGVWDSAQVEVTLFKRIGSACAKFTPPLVYLRMTENLKSPITSGN